MLLLAESALRAEWSPIDRITVDPVVCHGDPTVCRLRMTVQSILELLAQRDDSRRSSGWLPALGA